jgi:hypothetical protein
LGIISKILSIEIITMASMQRFLFPAVFLLSVATSASAQAYGSSNAASGSCPSGDWSARNLKTIQTIYDLTVYPKNVPIITGGEENVPPNLFSANATGRFSPVGEFEGFEDCRPHFQ